MGTDGVSQNELALVLRRAAEIDLATDGAAGTERLPVSLVEAAAAEVGLAPAAVRQAVVELRAGLLRADGEQLSATVARVSQVVPLPQEAALAAVGRWLSAQTFHRHRGGDGLEVWRPREDWLAGFQRRLDWAAAVRLKETSEVVVRTVAVEGGTLVHLQATLTGPARLAPGLGAGAGAAVGGSGAGLAIAAAGPEGIVVAAAVGAVGALGAAGGWLAGRRVRRARHDHVADELEAALSRIATGIEERNSLDRLRERARRLRPGPTL